MRISKEIMLEITKIQTEVLRNSDFLNVIELSDIKVQARELYENLVWLQYEAEGRTD
jgi:hypothetical protein